MVLIIGPLYSGKRAAAASILGCNVEELSRRAVWDVQELAAETVGCSGTDSGADVALSGADSGGPDAALSDAEAGAVDMDALVALADRLARYEAVIATETGGGVVPADSRTRGVREAAGRLNCLLADRAAAVVRVFCGIPVLIRGELPGTVRETARRDLGKLPGTVHAQELP